MSRAWSSSSHSSTRGFSRTTPQPARAPMASGCSSRPRPGSSPATSRSPTSRRPRPGGRSRSTRRHWCWCRRTSAWRSGCSVPGARRPGRWSGRAATAAFLPSVSVALDYGFQGPDVAFRSSNDFWLASVVVSWNLFNGGRDAARRSEAGYEADRARTQRQDLADRIALQVRTAHEAAVVARSAIVTADARLEAARRTFELVRRRYEEGVATPIEFVDARTAYTSAQLNRVLTAYRYAIRWVELERAAALREIPS